MALSLNSPAPTTRTYGAGLAAGSSARTGVERAAATAATAPNSHTRALIRVPFCSPHLGLGPATGEGFGAHSRRGGSLTGCETESRRAARLLPVIVGRSAGRRQPDLHGRLRARAPHV